MEASREAFEEWFREHARVPIDPWHKEFARTVWQASEARLLGVLEAATEWRNARNAACSEVNDKTMTRLGFAESRLSQAVKTILNVNAGE